MCCHQLQGSLMYGVGGGGGMVWSRLMMEVQRIWWDGSGGRGSDDASKTSQAPAFRSFGTGADHGGCRRKNQSHVDTLRAVLWTDDFSQTFRPRLAQQFTWKANRHGLTQSSSASSYSSSRWQFLSAATCSFSWAISSSRGCWAALFTKQIWGQICGNAGAGCEVFWVISSGLGITQGPVILC